MADFYARLADTAKRLIDDKGIDCTITSQSVGAGFDPVTGLPLPQLPPSEHSARCVVLNYSEAVKNMPQSLIEQGDKKLLIAAKGNAMPTLGGKVTVGEDSYTVVAVTDTKPSDTAILYEVHGRL